MRLFIGVVPVALGVLLAPTVAQALQCGSGRTQAHYPSSQKRVPAGSDIWQHCSSDACVPPRLEVGGAEVPLSEVERRRVAQLGDRWRGEKWLVRYRPREALQPTVEAYLNAESEGLPFEVVPAEEGPVGAPPRLLGIGYDPYVLSGGGHIPLAASFYFELDDRMLVVDVGEPDEDPLENVAFDDTLEVEYDGPHSGALLYRLGTVECGSTFLETAPGVTTRARFGFLDALGGFSGWTDFYTVEFPESGEAVWIPASEASSAGVGAPAAADDDTDGVRAPEASSNVRAEPADVTGFRSDAGCAVAVPARTSEHAGWLVALAPLLASLRRRRRRA